MTQSTRQSKPRKTVYQKRLAELNERLIRADSRRDGTDANEREYTMALNALILHMEKG
jgi:hypothetical protein